ncbi:hypothetical protein GF342_05090 [Candidatus Woesearchaeota archaeon]|nr:hypothetical protein [Candidatus Woesearchaeota archaeon]
MKLDSLDNAKEELKRADHLFYVSLKYTRTVDVIKSVIERLINASSFAIEALLYHLQDEKKLEELPKFPVARANLVLKHYPTDEQLKDYIAFFLLLRKIDKAEFTRSQEFRRHVTMTCEIDGETLTIKIDDIKEYFEKVKKFVTYIEHILEGEEDE